MGYRIKEKWLWQFSLINGARERLHIFVFIIELATLEKYPEDLRDIARLYRTGEKFVRFLMAKGDNRQFVELADALIDEKMLNQTVDLIHAKEFSSFERFATEFDGYKAR